MPGSAKPQRVRDPLHNLIEFQTNQLERTLWRVVQTRPFQRLRRIRQLGFSEMVFPGATHTRFAHCIGVFHTARQLMQIIGRHAGNEFGPHQAEVALAAALVHDVGHGMFSHTFEDVAKKLKLQMASHEQVGEALIRNGEIAEVFRKELGSGFADDVADVLARNEPKDFYGSVVSSQFDADRLDYMQRDRLMTGVQSSGIDATWLMANLEIGSVRTSADDETSAAVNTVDTLVLGPKAFRAAENYVLSLFQLYPNVYLHKTTRAAEKLFSCLMLRVFELIRSGHTGKIGLMTNHPILRFAEDPSSLENTVALDDSVFWGAVPMMAEAKDPLIRDCAVRLWERRLPKCIDLRRHFDEQDPLKPGMSPEERQEREAKLRISCKNNLEQIKEFAKSRGPDKPQILVDEARRTPYKKYQDSKTPLNQILIKHGEGRFEDMAHLSAVVASAETFEICRVYYNSDDTEGLSMLKNIIGTKRRGSKYGWI